MRLQTRLRLAVCLGTAACLAPAAAQDDPPAYHEGESVLVTGGALGRRASDIRDACHFPPTGEISCEGNGNYNCTTCGWIINRLETLSPHQFAWSKVQPLGDQGFRPLPSLLDAVSSRARAFGNAAVRCAPNDSAACGLADQARAAFQQAMVSARDSLETATPQDEEISSAISGEDLGRYADKVRPKCDSPDLVAGSKGYDRVVSQFCRLLVERLDKAKRKTALKVGSVGPPPAYERMVSIKEGLEWIDAAYFDLKEDARRCGSNDSESCVRADQDRGGLHQMLSDCAEAIYQGIPILE